MQLDNQQQKAVYTDSDKVLVLAGAGSGKTRVLTERIAYLIEQKKVSPYEICAFTFTRKASGEMNSRLENRIEGKAHKVTMSTMHALGLNMIHKFGETIGLKAKNVTVYSEWEESYLLKEVAIELGIFKKTWKIPKKKVIDPMFAAYYERGIEPTRFDPGYALFKAFIHRCKENNALTYGALLIGLEMLIPTMAKYLHYRHILVDEVQDIDPLQHQIIDKLCKAFNASLFFVGDIDQSIYEWRGAVPKYLIEHQDEFDIYRIETNYRSDAYIVHAANSLIEYNQDRLAKTMRPFEDPQTKIQTHTNMDSERILFLIRELNEKSPNVRRAVLSRYHTLLKKLSSFLNQFHIPHAYIGEKTALTNSEEFRRFHAFLKLIVNPFDNFSFLLIRELIGVSRGTYLTIRVMASEQGKSHFQTWMEMDDPKDVGTWQDLFSEMTPNFAVETIVNDLSFCEWDFEIDDIVKFISNWFQETHGSIQEYLSWLATYDIQDELTEESENLQLMTIHAAKGLEWPTVIIAGVNEGLLPSKQAIKSGDIEAERRLAYVAWTRAEDTLILTVRPETKTSETGKVYRNPVSRFIGESINGRT